MLSVRIPTELENRLSLLSSETNRPKSFYVKEALEKCIEELENKYISIQREDESWMNDDSVPAKRDRKRILKAVQDLNEGKYVELNLDELPEDR